MFSFIKVVRYSFFFFEAKPIFFNRIKSDFILVRKNPHHIKITFQDRKEKIYNFQASQYDIKQHFELI